MDEATQLDHVPRATFFWIVGGLVTIQIAANGFIYSSIDGRLNRQAERLGQVERKTEQLDLTVSQDIRNILIGIEEIRGRINNLE